MTAITLDTSESIEEFQKTEIFPEKPRSLKTAEAAIPVLKTLGLILAGAAILGAVLTGIGAFTVGFIPSLAIFAGACAAASIASLLIGKWVKSRVDNLANPQWVDYYSSAYQNRPLAELMIAVPNRNAWTKLHWANEVWKDKIFPYAITHRMDRLDLHREFKSLFDRFDPLLHDYYRQVESTLLADKGFLELMHRSVDQAPVALTPDEIREALLKETAPFSCKTILAKYGALPFNRDYLLATDLIPRFEEESDSLSLSEIHDQYRVDLLNRGILTTEKFVGLLNKSEETDFIRLEKKLPSFTTRPDWFQSPKVQNLFIQMLGSPSFSLSRSNLFRFTEGQFEKLSAPWPALLAELHSDLANAYLGPSSEAIHAKIRYESEPSQKSTLTLVPYTYTDDEGNSQLGLQSVVVWVDNPKKAAFLAEYETWMLADERRQEDAYLALDRLARQKIATAHAKV